jgi:dTDP-4-dehydrorhamnose reductase
MRIAIFGADGQLGTALQEELDGDVRALGHADVDISESQSVHKAIADTKPDVVINAAAYNFVDRAEDEVSQAYSVNAIGPQNLAVACKQRAITLVHISTDYVFSGWGHSDQGPVPRTAPYSETDRPNPRSSYAKSKLAGEAFLQAQTDRYYVVRTCGLYGEARVGGKGNFVKTMLRLGRERDEVRVVNDQWCTPTSAADLARVIRKLIRTKSYGLYHATNSGSTTWHDFACEIFRQTRLDVRVTPITTEEFAAKAPRPRYSVLSNAKLAATIGGPLPPWQTALAEYLKKLEHADSTADG